MLITNQMLSRLGPRIPHRGGVVKYHGSEAAMESTKTASVFSLLVSHKRKKKRASKMSNCIYLLGCIFSVTDFSFLFSSAHFNQTNVTKTPKSGRISLLARPFNASLTHKTRIRLFDSRPPLKVTTNCSCATWYGRWP